MIMLCVTTVSYSFKVHEEPVGNVHPTRGIHQGDPLSPTCLLFVWRVYRRY